ncbi:unnamed protein product [Ixodes hexagonus]
MDPIQLQRLRESQQKGLQSCEAKLERWAQFERDYESLCGRLDTLADRVSHEVMVPLNSLAFMPGRLVHTNEVLVLLGDNWFAQRSARQAFDIAKRRADQCRRMLKDLENEKEQRSNWIKYTDELQRESACAAEIREPYDPAEEAAWRERHRESVRDYHRSKKNAQDSRAGDDREMWEMLDRLERQEEREQEPSTSGEETSSRKVRWQDESSVHITFSHSDTSLTDTCTAADVTSTESVVMSPGDIFRMFGGNENSIGKSILKCAAEATSRAVERPVPEVKEDPPWTTRLERRRDDAFTGAVVEHEVQLPSDTTLDIDVTNIEIPQALRRPRSLFKLKRDAK